MSVELLNFIETVLNGLMSGVMYSLVALGFVLIFNDGDYDCSCMDNRTTGSKTPC